MGAIGVFGGSFDPVHVAHLVVAEGVREALGLASVLFVPAHRQPLKASAPVASGEDRLAMLRLAVADHPGFEVSSLELERGGTSFTVDTLAQLHACEPAAELSLILGADVFLLAGRWRRFEEVRRLARLVLVARPGVGEQEVKAAGETPLHVQVPAMDVSASEIRRRISAGRSIRYLVPEPVRRYIAERGLYR